MRLSKKTERSFRTILLILTTSACICITIFIFLQFTERNNSEKAEGSKRNVLQPEKLTDEKCTPVCDSRSCINQANILLRSINPTNDPCENFQKFLCGTYEEAAGRYENKSMMSDMTLIMLNKLKSIIENIKAEPGSAAEKMKIVYDSCVNLGSSEVRGVDNFRQILTDVEIFNWPYLASDFKFSDNGLLKLLATFGAYLEVRWFGIRPMNEEGTQQSEKLMQMVYIGQFEETPAIPRDTAVAILRYFSMESEDIEILLNDHDDVRSYLISFNKEFEMDFDEYEANYSDIRINCSSAENNEWEYVCGIYQIYLNVTNLKQHVNRNEIVISAYSVHPIRNLYPRLKELSDRSVANFFAMELFWNHLDEVNFFFRLEKQKYFNYFKSEKTTKEVDMPRSSKWEYCVTWVAENMKIVLENELVKSYLTKSYVDEIHDFHKNITFAVMKMINRQQGISEFDKIFMTANIGNLDCNMVLLKNLLPNDTYVNEFLKTFKPTRTNFLQNSLYYRKALINAHTVLTIKHDRMTEPNFEANAETDKEMYIVLHYGLLMPPVYFPGHEKFINHILLAPIFGHEIGHNLIHFLDGSSMNSERKSCIENQFSKFKFTHLDENLNGTRYFEESLSDNLGFAVADKMIDDLEDVFVLPGLTYTSKQLLYMNTRQIFCTKNTEKMEIYFQTNEKHAPPEYRMIASGQNSKGYSEAFNCPLGSYMNPEEKCSLFDSV